MYKLISKDLLIMAKYKFQDVLYEGNGKNGGIFNELKTTMEKYYEGIEGIKKFKEKYTAYFHKNNTDVLLITSKTNKNYCETTPLTANNNLQMLSLSSIGRKHADRFIKHLLSK